MKGTNKYLMPIVLLLCVILSSVLLAEHRDTGQGIMSETLKDRYKHHKRDRRMDLRTKDSIHQKQFQENSIANASSDAWKIEAVDAPKYFSNSSSRAIAIDAHNYPHIAYGGDHLYYAYFHGSKWIYETVDASPGVGSDASIALDSSGKVHISYFDYSNKDLMYATNAYGTWVTITVDSDGDVGWYTSIAIDSRDKAHISYFDNNNNDLKYATNASGTWVTTTVDSVYSDGFAWLITSIAIDSKDKAHISYYDNSSDDIKHATNASGTWVMKTVDSDVVVWNTSIAMDSRDMAHISYSDSSNDDLKYATNASGTWVTTTVDSDGDVGGGFLYSDRLQ